jgi:carbon storage regulator
MLILTRKQNEKIWLGDDIQVMVVDIIGNKVRIGFNAPSKIEIFREEIYSRIRRERMSCTV